MVVDPSLDSSQRIAVLQQKLSELRKAYADVKAELATVERRRKKLRRREREGNKPYTFQLAAFFLTNHTATVHVDLPSLCK